MRTRATRGIERGQPGGQVGEGGAGTLVGGDRQLERSPDRLGVRRRPSEVPGDGVPGHVEVHPQVGGP